MRKRSLSEFIFEARKVHGDKYDYSRVVYESSVKRVCIICPEHGEFWQIADGHLRGAGCPKCSALSRRSNIDNFIKTCRELYGDYYDYSKVKYVHSKEKVCIICPKHGEFWMTPNAHMRGHRCPKCYGTPKKTKEQFIEQAKKIHGDKYDYSKVNYVTNKEKVCIICPIHGEFWQTPFCHLKGRPCPSCRKVLRITQESFIERCTMIHHGKYDYSKVKYEHANKRVCIICPEHGEFWQKAGIHLRGYGCPICGGSQRLTTEEFIEKANKVHENKYDYSKAEYVNTSTKVCIICPEHGEFWQTPNSHLFGAGCPACPQSALEEKMRKLLTAQGIRFEAEKSFSWLRSRKKMFIDFFLPDYSVAIECQGRQHFAPSDYYGGQEEFELVVERDAKKKELCEKHGIKMLYYSNLGIDYPYPVYEDFGILLDAIKNSDTNPNLWRDPEIPFVFDD